MTRRLLIAAFSVLGALGACHSTDAPTENGMAGTPSRGGDNGASSGNGGALTGGGGAHSSAGSAGRTEPPPGSAGTGGEPNSAGAGNEAGNANAGDAGSGAAAGAPEALREVAYVATALHGLSACAIDTSSGEPELLAGSPSDATVSIHAIAVNQAAHMLYAAKDGQIDSYHMATDGNLPARPGASLATPNDVNTLALDPKGRFVYGGSAQGRAIDVFAIDADSGALSAAGGPVPVGSDSQHGGAAYVAADPSGRFVYVSQSFELGIRGYRVGALGVLDELAGSPFAASGAPEAQAVFGGALAIKPSGDFLYASGGSLHGFALDPASGTLSPLAGSPFSLDVQSDPDASNLALDPTGTYLYATHFLGTNHISGFAVDQRTGALEEVPGSPFLGSAPYALAVDRSARFLFVGNDGPDGLSVFEIGRSTGSLTQLSKSPFTIGGLEPAIVFGLVP